MSFVFPSIALLGAALAAGPIVVHLLTRRRRRVVAWSAMGFLLDASDRRAATPRWSHWLLLATRVAAVAFTGLLLAKPITPDAFAAWLTDRPTTYLVLLDDSYSMAERDTEGTPWGRAVDAITRLAEQRGERAELVVLTTSSVAQGASPLVLAAADASIASIRRAIEAAPPSVRADDPVDAVAGLRALASAAADRGENVYACLLTDFRRRGHGDTEAAIAGLAAEIDGVMLVDCSGPPTVNRTVADVSFAPGARAAGVEMVVRAEVVNHGPLDAGETNLTLRLDGKAAATLAVPAIAPGARVTVSRAVRFAEPGFHAVSVEATSDAIDADNTRRLALTLPVSHEVLLVDGSRSGDEGRAYAAALRPKGDVRTGWRPRVRRAEKVDRLDGLDDFAAVALLDPRSITPSATRRLRGYVEDGGGLLLALGPQAVVADLNDTFAASGMSLLTTRLGTPTQAPWPSDGKAAISVSDHPVFRVLTGRRNGFLPLVRPAMTHTLDEVLTAGVDVLARLSDGSPLAVEQLLGKGRVITLLTTAAARGEGDQPWSNLATLPVFPVLANELIGWLAQQRLAPMTRLVGDAFAGGSPSRVDRITEAGEPIAIDLTDGAATFSYDVPGVYRDRVSQHDEGVIAVNVDPHEGDLRRLPLEEIRALYGEHATVVRAADAFQPRDRVSTTASTRLLAITLFGLLAVERLIARRSGHADAVTLPGLAQRRAA